MKSRWRSVVLLLAALALSACGSVDDEDLAGGGATPSGNRAPVADAGGDQTVGPGDVVTLDGGGSFDLDGDGLEYLWTPLEAPALSGAQLLNPTTVSPSFVADRVGVYRVRLDVSDGESAASSETRVEALAGWANEPPVAVAGADQSVVTTGTLVTLSSAGSFDPQGFPLRYSWAFRARPAGSAAELSNSAAAAPTFRPDEPGTYEVQLVVNNDDANSAPDAVMVEVSGASKAVAATLYAGACADCHGTTGEGMFGPDIRGLDASAILASLDSAIHAGITLDSLDAEEIAAFLAH